MVGYGLAQDRGYYVAVESQVIFDSIQHMMPESPDTAFTHSTLLN